MHKYLLSFLLLWFLNPVVSKAQGIGTVRIQYANPGINNNLDVIAQVTIPSQPAYRISNSSRVSNDTLYVTACYYSGIATAPKQLTDTISIGSPPPGLTTLHFKIFTSASTSQCTQIGSSFKNLAFVISAPLGIKANAEKHEVLLYPNPATDLLWIKSNSVRSIIIRDLTGKIIQRKTLIDETPAQLDVRFLNKGLYQVEIFTQNGTKQTQKLLKN